MTDDDIPLAGVEVLLKVGDNDPIPIGGIVVERDDCHLTRVGMRLVELGEQMLDLVARCERAS